MALDFCLSHNYFWYDGKFYTQKRGVALGAKFALSLANLFMTEWEDKCIFGKKRRELLFFKHFIDDLFFIWSGMATSLIEFSQELNTNTNNIKLEFCWSDEQINYLDVNIMNMACIPG